MFCGRTTRATRAKGIRTPRHKRHRNPYIYILYSSYIAPFYSMVFIRFQCEGSSQPVPTFQVWFHCDSVRYCVTIQIYLSQVAKCWMGPGPSENGLYRIRLRAFPCSKCSGAKPINDFKSGAFAWPPNLHTIFAWMPARRRLQMPASTPNLGANCGKFVMVEFMIS